MLEGHSLTFSSFLLMSFHLDRVLQISEQTFKNLPSFTVSWRSFHTAFPLPTTDKKDFTQAYESPYVWMRAKTYGRTSSQEAISFSL